MDRGRRLAQGRRRRIISINVGNMNMMFPKLAFAQLRVKVSNDDDCCKKDFGSDAASKFGDEGMARTGYVGLLATCWRWRKYPVPLE